MPSSSDGSILRQVFNDRMSSPKRIQDGRFFAELKGTFDFDINFGNDEEFNDSKSSELIELKNEPTNADELKGSTGIQAFEFAMTLPKGIQKNRFFAELEDTFDLGIDLRNARGGIEPAPLARHRGPLPLDHETPSALPKR